MLAGEVPADYNGSAEDFVVSGDDQIIFRVIFDGDGDVDLSPQDGAFVQHARLVLPFVDEGQFPEEYKVKAFINLPRAMADTRFVFSLGVFPGFVNSNFYRLTDDCPKGNE